MTDRQFCENCSQRHDCRKIYEQLSQSKTPSVLRNVIVAFLLPIGLFIVSLAIFEKVFPKWIGSKAVLTAVSLILAAAIAFGGMLVARRSIKTKGSRSNS